MYLDPVGLKIFKNYRRWRMSPPTMWSLFFGQTLATLFLFGLGGATGYGYYATDLVPLLFVSGLATGVLVYHLALCKSIPASWEVIQQVLDWDKIDRALRESDEQKGQASTPPPDEPTEITLEHLEPDATASSRRPPGDLYRPGR